ncbi:hypothetical protein JR316_0013065 [Psilocybe cubensis]|uniref:Uncharacterized protein n=2 Tax=Psilocybe cubensis TaxID=181762 RepID=A0A8H7XU01_PSICU|nr:hypothetical protein JR316_0013065 [Psilocybe cubensis]KAH9474602.1 hypothetical protein JR316_0013065 [Psilocybe cubensis]
MTSPTETPLVVESSAGGVHPAPAVSESRNGSNVTIRDGFIATITFAKKLFDEVVMPSISSFIETSRTNPRVAAIAGTPALLAFLFTAAFLIFSTLTLIIWTIITVVFGIVFVIIGGFKALLVKLMFVIITAIPLTVIGTSLLVCGNSLAHMIIRQLPGRSSSDGSTPSSTDEVDWQRVAEALARNTIQGVRSSIPLIHAVFETIRNVFRASYTSFWAAIMLMHDTAARDAGAFTRSTPTPPQPPTGSTENSTPVGSRATEVVSPPLSDSSDQEIVVIEPVNLPSTSNSGKQIPTLHQRAAFKRTGDNDEN